MNGFRFAVLAGVAVAALAGQAVQAQEHWRHEGFRPHAYYLERWGTGRWFHGFHGALDGWWWVVEGAWYFYPAPVYPYPQPPVIVAAPPPQPLPQAQAYYYCPNPPGYYPTVPACVTGWQMVPVPPTAPPQFAPPPAVAAPPPPR